MNKILKVGIAGYGVVGQRRRHFIDQHSGLETVAVCDKIFGEKGDPRDGLTFHRNYRDLLNEELDLLFVCMPNDIAPEITVAGLERGHHVFCEKPPGRTVEDIVKVVECEQRHPGQKLKYGFNHRYHQSVKDALSIVNNGELGAVINLRGVYGKSKFISFGKDHDWRTDRAQAGGGILLDQGIHMVDLMRLFAGEFEKVYSFVSNDYWHHDVEDNAYALMRTAGGTVAMLHSSATQWRHRFNLDITLERGAIILSGILSGSKSYGEETLIIARVGEDDRGDPVEETRNYEIDNSWKEEIEEFADAVINDVKIGNGSSDDAMKTMQLVYKIYCSDPDWRAAWKLDDGKPIPPDEKGNS